MATFYLMQSVRVVRCFWPELIGREGTIIEINFMSPPFATFPYLVRVDGFDQPLWGSSYHLEPLQPERNRVVAWEDCPWQPNREFVS